MDASDPLHHDEVRMLRKNRWIALPVSQNFPDSLQFLTDFFSSVTSSLSHVQSAPRENSSSSHSLLVTLLVSSVPLFPIQLTLLCQSWTRPPRELRLWMLPRNSASWECGTVWHHVLSWSVPSLHSSGSSTMVLRSHLLFHDHHQWKCQNRLRRNSA